MESSIKYKGDFYDLCDDFIDIGYMAENIQVQTCDNEDFLIKRSHPNGAMSLLISFPNLDEVFKEELIKIDAFLSDIQVDIFCYFVFDKKNTQLIDLNKTLKKFKIVFDAEDEFGDMYGTKIVSGDLQDKLTKSLFLISKDGAVFFLDMPNVLEKEFDIQRLRAELNRAYVTYTGTGCH